jgi:mono/diheme cytochrome c family protein
MRGSLRALLTTAAAVLLICLLALGVPRPAPAARAVGGVARQTATTADAPALYKKHCATCHGNDGRAKTFKGKMRGARDLTKAEWHAEVTDERIFNSIAQGRSGGMPSFKKKLTTAQIESLVAHVRGLKK